MSFFALTLLLHPRLRGLITHASYEEVAMGGGGGATPWVWTPTIPPINPWSGGGGGGGGGGGSEGGVWEGRFGGGGGLGAGYMPPRPSVG